MNLVWLRRDLRVQDHPALRMAIDSGNTEILYLDSEPQWKFHNESDLSIEYRKRRVNQLAVELGILGVKLNTASVNLFSQTAEYILKFCLKNSVQNFYFIKETPFDEAQRDQNVIELLHQNNIQVHALPFDLIVSQPVLNLSELPFRVFTPFYKKWLSMIESPQRWMNHKVKKQARVIKNAVPYSTNSVFDNQLKKHPTKTLDLVEKLHHFCQNKIDDYQEQRDYPNNDATSMLSAPLAYGMIGPRQCLSAIKKAHDEKNSHWRTDFWLRELAWRDFYRQLMVHFPHISKNQNFKPKTEKIIWQNNQENIEAWKKGLTGFPIIDAAMRQLNTTGWMHNRLRMLAASFFTKLMFEDWKIGEAYFMSQLIDGEFAANNGGWQWSSSTGCDSAPYFRVFNPTTQSERYDKDGEFIKKYVPELSKLSSKSIHNPTEEERSECGYPNPIIDYKSARMDAIEKFKSYL